MNGHTDREVIGIVASLARAKAKEDAAKADRIRIEEDLLAAVGFDLTRGSKTYAFVDGDASCKVVLGQPITVSIDQEALENLFESLSPKHPGRLIFRKKWELDGKESTSLLATDPTSYRAVAGVISSKPGKPSVEIKALAIAGGV